MKTWREVEMRELWTRTSNRKGYAQSDGFGVREHDSGLKIHLDSGSEMRMEQRATCQSMRHDSKT